ncbi:hypothetical protein P0D69_34245 [Paraburkholderia sediminicola]|uniref:hypothetical protein n=1 Tax=Paraburkholderia sediminicola TaxID=458836 RepID=UPI0038B6CAFC
MDSILLPNGPFMVSALGTLPTELAFYALIAAMLICKWINRTATATHDSHGAPVCQDCECLPPTLSGPQNRFNAHGRFGDPVA